MRRSRRDRARSSSPPTASEADSATGEAPADREDSPERLRRRLRGDLDNIVLMALRREPERRYQSVEQLSEDIRRHLESLPVMARKDTLPTALQSSCDGTRSATAAAMLVFLSLLGGIVATTWQAHGPGRRKHSRTRRRRERKGASTTCGSWPTRCCSTITTRSRTCRVRRLYASGWSRMGSLIWMPRGRGWHDRALQRELAAAYERVGDVRGQAYSANLGDLAGAMESYLKALRIREALVGTVQRTCRLVATWHAAT